jgi:outer membrane receptor protein involved in Fe transport
LIAPDEKWSIKLGALLQNISTDGTNYELVNPASHQPLYGDLTQSSIIHEPFNGQYRLYTSSIKWDNPIGQAVSETSYSSLNALGYRDFSIPFGLPSSQTYGTFTNKWTQEFRLVTPSDRTVQWTTGIFYTSEESGHPQDYENIPVQSTPLIAVEFPSTYREYAIYADPTWHITPALDLTLGGRWSDISQHFSVVESGAFVGPSPLTASGPATNRVWNWLVNPSYHLNTDTLLYVRVATGFQPGGANIVLPGEKVPPVFYPDTTINYEVGVKSEFLERRALLNVAVFDIEWHHIQLLQQYGSFTAFGNAGNARSKGVELSATYIPISNLTLAASGAYTEAFLTTAAPGVGGAEGSALPNVPRWSGSLSADYSVPLTAGIKGFAGATVRMEGERHAYFPDSLTAGGNTPFELEAFSALDLRAGLTKDVWQVQLYGKNVTNRRGELSVATLGPTQPASLILLQPRTVGIKLSRTF